MAITVPNTINNITSSQIVTQSGQACVPANLLDANFQALANPVNPIIAVTGSISLSIANSGNIYILDSLSANATITLPSPTNGFNVVFGGNNTSSYNYTFTTPSGFIQYGGYTGMGSSIVLNCGIGKQYYFVSDGVNYFVFETSNPYIIPRNTVIFTSSGSWTVPQGVTTILVSGCAGGGGGGGGATTNSTAGNAVSGGGGGAGQSVIKKSISVTPGHLLSITIGAGGSGGAGGAANGNAGSAGGNGGNTILYDSTSSTTLLTLSAGNGGSGGNPNSSQAGASGGVGYPGGGYSPDSTSAGGISGTGGSTPFGGGGTSVRASISSSFVGSMGFGYGSGGSGGGASYGNTTYAGGAGGAGASGILIIEW
jgi:hypothetical protein